MTEISIEIECSQFTDGRYWAGDYWVTLATVLVPESLDISGLEDHELLEMAENNQNGVTWKGAQAASGEGMKERSLWVPDVPAQEAQDCPGWPPIVCGNCGKDLEDFGDLGCHLCDVRNPTYGLL